MKLSLNNFLYGIKQIVTGNTTTDGGFLRDTHNLIGESVLATSVTYIADGSGYPVLNAAASITAVAAIPFILPRDYDEAVDVFTVEVVAYMAGATDTPTLTLDPDKQVIGSASSQMAVSSGSLTTAALSTTATKYTFSLSANGLLRDTLVKLTLTSGAHTTDALRVLSVRITYRSTLVSYNEFASDRVTQLR